MFSNRQLERMQATQTKHMPDTCRRMVYTPGAIDEYGKPAPAWVEQVTDLECGLEYPARRREEQLGNQADVREAELRLPFGTVITRLDRLKVTHRFGDELETPLTFELVGEPGRGPSGLLLNLKLVMNAVGR